ncbi:hypothetical protein TWF694_005229 [Orbilia ellipsospora]|uniref:Uncharacterized protein n=1 Tax=Orbilia ellipsospora TaxID=2528407 RepID=A0AAV9WUY7_9PEZI
MEQSKQSNDTENIPRLEEIISSELSRLRFNDETDIFNHAVTSNESLLMKTQNDGWNFKWPEPEAVSSNVTTTQQRSQEFTELSDRQICPPDCPKAQEETLLLTIYAAQQEHMLQLYLQKWKRDSNAMITKMQQMRDSDEGLSLDTVQRMISDEAHENKKVESLPFSVYEQTLLKGETRSEEILA